MGTPRLNILLLGPPMVTLDGKPVKINRRIPKALLYYLASNLQPVTRTAVCDFFWPDEPEERARKHLREALSGLRADLEISDLIKSADEQLFLNLDQCYLDTEEYSRIVYPLLKSSELNSSGRLPDWMTGQLIHAIELCRTPHFLQGIQLPGSPGFERWLEFTNNTLNFSRSKIIERLIDHYISNGDLDEAILWLGKGLETDPLDQEKNFLALTCLRDMGKMQQLVDHVNYLESLYKTKEETIPAQFLQMRSQAEESRNVSPNISVSTWPVANHTNPKFVGRQEELNTLNRLMRRKGVMLLRGEAGAGKTRLLKEFFDQQPYAPRLVYCQAHQMAIQVPFQTLVEGLEKIIQPEDWNLIEEKDREILSRFFHHQLQNPESPVSPNSGERWLPVMQDTFYSFLRLMEKVALKRPVLFVLDDAGWSDAASLTLMGFLIENGYFKKNGMLIIVTRLERSNESLNQMVINLKRSHKLETLNLQNFTYEETGQFIHQMTGIKPNPVFLQKMLDNTGGNPFFLVECILEVKNSDLETSSFTEKDRRAIPESIDGLVWEKVHLLKPGTVNVLFAATVLGNWFTSDVLELMNQLDTESFLTALVQIKQAGFINVDMEVKPAGGYRFCHDIEREIIELSLDPARRRDLHLKAAEAIIRRRGKIPELASNLAHHYEVAGEFLQAMEFWTIAGEEGQKQPSPEVAYGYYSRALELVKQNSFLYTPEQVLALINKWADYAYDLDDNETCQEVYSVCLDVGYQLKSPLLIGSGLSGMGRFSASVAKFEAARNYFDNAVSQLRKSGNLGELYENYCRLGILYIKLDDYKSATQAFEEGIQQIGELDDDRSLEARINLLTQLGILYCYQGQPLRAYQLALEMADLSLLVKRVSANLQAAAIQMMTLYYTQRFREVIHLRETFSQLPNQVPVREWLTIMDLSSANSYLQLGDLDNAYMYVNQAIERETGHPYQKLIDTSQMIKADIFRQLGEFEKAIELYQHVIDTGAYDPPTVECHLNKGLSLNQLGRFEEGLASLDTCISLAAAQGFTSIELTARISRLLVEKKTYSAERFTQLAGTILEEMKASKLLGTSFYEGFVPVVAATMKGDTEIALDLLQKLSEHTGGYDSIWVELRALVCIAAFAPLRSHQRNEARVRLSDLMDKMSAYANTAPVKAMFLKFRKQILRGEFVNILSTVMRYK